MVNSLSICELTKNLSAPQDMSNPITRRDMVFYPNDAGGRLGEVWDASKMLRDAPDHLLTPAVKHLRKIFYINELVQRTGHRWFLPTRWFTRNGAMWAMGHHVVDTVVRFILFGFCIYRSYLFNCRKDFLSRKTPSPLFQLQLS